MEYVYYSLSITKENKMKKLLIAAICSLAFINTSFAYDMDDDWDEDFYEEFDERPVTRSYVGRTSGYARSYQYDSYAPSRSYNNDSGLSSKIPNYMPSIHTYQFGGNQVRCQTFDNMLGDITYCN